MATIQDPSHNPKTFDVSHLHPSHHGRFHAATPPPETHYPPSPHVCAYWSGSAWVLPSAHPRGDHLPKEGEEPHFVCWTCQGVGHTKDFCMGRWACRVCGYFFLEGDHTVRDEGVTFGERHSACFDLWCVCRICTYPSFVDAGGTTHSLIFDRFTHDPTLPPQAFLPRHEGCADPFGLSAGKRGLNLYRHDSGDAKTKRNSRAKKPSSHHDGRSDQSTTKPRKSYGKHERRKGVRRKQRERTRKTYDKKTLNRKPRNPGDEDYCEARRCEEERTREKLEREEQQRSKPPPCFGSMIEFPLLS